MGWGPRREDRSVEFSEEFGGLTALACGSIGTDTIVGGEGSDALLHDAVLRGLRDEGDAFCVNGLDVILGEDGRPCCALHEIVAGGVGDDVLFGDDAADILAQTGSEWAGGGGEDVLVGAQDAALVVGSAWTDGVDAVEFAAAMDDLQAGGRMLWAGGGADSLDLSGLAA